MNDIVERSVKDDVAILYDMETNNYLMECAISKLNKRIASLGKKAYIAKPQKMKATYYDVAEEVFGFAAMGAFGGGILGAIIGLVADGFLAGFVGMLIGGVIAGVCGIILGAINLYNKKTKEQEKIERKYASDCSRARKNEQADSARVKRELRQREALIEQRDLLLKKYEESRRITPSFYNKIGIDEKFRNIVAIGYMNEFIRLGISEKFDGIDGLYYLIMQELRWDQMNHTLTEISNRLNEIIDNQRQIYHELIYLNSKCDKIINDTAVSIANAERNNMLCEELVNQTQLAVYAAERVEKELMFQNYLLLT